MLATPRTAIRFRTTSSRVDGQPSVYLPVMKQGGDTNTIAVVDGVKELVSRLVDVPKELTPRVVFDQSLFVKRAIETLLDEGGIGLALTALMVLVFLGSFRATAAVFLSIPLSALAAIIALYMGGSSINTMILAGFALVFSRLIDNAVIVLENIFRHMEMGESPEVAAEKGGDEVALAVLAATLTSCDRLLPGHVPLWRQPVPVFGLGPGGGAGAVCVLLRRHDGRAAVLREAASRHRTTRHRLEPARRRRPQRRLRPGWRGSTPPSPRDSSGCWCGTNGGSARSLERPGRVVVAVAAIFVASLMIYPLLGVAFFRAPMPASSWST